MPNNTINSNTPATTFVVLMTDADFYLRTDELSSPGEAYTQADFAHYYLTFTPTGPSSKIATMPLYTVPQWLTAVEYYQAGGSPTYTDLSTPTGSSVRQFWNGINSFTGTTISDGIKCSPPPCESPSPFSESLSIELIGYIGRMMTFAISLCQPDGISGLTLQSGDVVRIKIGRGSTTILDIDTVTPLAGGSLATVTQLTAPATISLLLAQADTAGLPPGNYDIEIDVSVAASSGAIQPSRAGVLKLLHSMGGNTGLTP